MRKLTRFWIAYIRLPEIVRFGVLLALAILVMLVLPGSAQADSEARNGANWVRITAEPCTNEKVLANIAGRGENPLDYRAARAEIAGDAFAACWAPDFKAKVVQLRYDDGDRGDLPWQAFRPVSGI